jgi:hypothetical protein
MNETCKRVVQTLECWCAQQGVCHKCHRKEVRLYRCPGCAHWYCFCCAHRLESSFVCDGCMTVWLGLMTQFTLTWEVTRWFNMITL